MPLYTSKAYLRCHDSSVWGSRPNGGTLTTPTSRSSPRYALHTGVPHGPDYF